ncbi:MAG: hypothetical protein Q7K16_03475 [Candidatus Azambacteria bacterium]|nr:hypothetical protein [Candidatus Azambacteria bacterium]
MIENFNNINTTEEEKKPSSERREFLYKKIQEKVEAILALCR